VFCQSIRIAGAAAAAAADEPTKGEAVGEDKLRAPAIGILALDEPATGKDLLSAPAWGTLTMPAVADEVRGAATSSAHERSETEQTTAKKIRAGKKARRIGATPQWQTSLQYACSDTRARFSATHHRHPPGDQWRIVPVVPTAQALEEEAPQTPQSCSAVPLETLDQLVPL
jgi:hypothetical protein